MHSGHSSYNAEESVKAGYEITDLNPGIIVVSLAVLAAMAAGSIFFIIIFLRGFDRSMVPMNTDPRSPLALESTIPLEGPHLQLFPVEECKAYFAASHAALESSGYVSQDPGMERVHIPIESAMALVAAGKVPYRQAPVTAAEDGEAAAETATQ